MPLSYRRTTLDGQPLHPATQMVSFGYDPALSEGAVKPPVFLTSTFAFRSAEEGAEFFDVVAGRKPAPEGMGAGGLVYSRFNHPNTEIVEVQETRMQTSGHHGRLGALIDRGIAADVAVAERALEALDLDLLAAPSQLSCNVIGRQLDRR